MEKELRGLEEEARAKIQLNSLRATLKKVPYWKTPYHDGIHGIWFSKIIYIKDKMAIKINRCLQEIDIPEWMTKEKTTLIQIDPQKGTNPQQQ